MNEKEVMNGEYYALILLPGTPQLQKQKTCLQRDIKLLTKDYCSYH